MDIERTVPAGGPPAPAPPAPVPVAAVVIVVAMAAIATALAIAVVVRPGPLPGELAIVGWLQSLGQPVPALTDVVRFTTGTEGALVVAAVPAGLLVRRCGRRGVVAVAIAAATMLVAQPVLKELVDRPRPSAELVDVRAEHTSMSFPSGHSMSTATVWGAAALVAAGRGRHGVAAALCVPIALTGVASSVQGVHWPSDAIAGTMLGGIAAIAIARTVRPEI